MSAQAPLSPALSAFLRGIERRAFVFAQLQCGRDREALAAVGRAMRAFGAVSAATPLSGWPAGFWSLLLAQAELSGGQSPLPELAALSSGPRAALLLRLVAGLDFPHAAQVLGVGEATYRFALQRALHQLGEAGISYAALGQLRERLHRQVKTLPEATVAALADERGRVSRGEPEPAPPAPPPPPPAWLRRLPWLGLGLLALAFAATFWEPAPPLPPGGTETLPPELPAEAPAPAAAAPVDADRVIHPDYAALAEAVDDTVSADLAFHSWLAGTGVLATAPAGGAPLPAPVDGPADDVVSFEALPAAQRTLLVPLAGAWPNLDPETRRQVIAHAAHWLALDEPARQALRERIAAWDALPAAERARRRGTHAAWLSLRPEERARVQAAARAFAALPEAERKPLQEAFAALPDDQRASWWLGPEVGGWFAPLQPLFAYVPEAQRPQLLEMLRGLSPEARTDLALLARRLPAEARETLRRDLLSAPPEAREALLRERLGR